MLNLTSSMNALEIIRTVTSQIRILSKTHDEDLLNPFQAVR